MDALMDKDFNFHCIKTPTFFLNKSFCVPQNKESPLIEVVVLGYTPWKRHKSVTGTSRPLNTPAHAILVICHALLESWLATKSVIYTDKAHKSTHTAALWPTAALKSHRCFGVFIMRHGRKHLVIKYVPPERYEGRMRMVKSSENKKMSLCNFVLF